MAERNENTINLINILFFWGRGRVIRFILVFFIFLFHYWGVGIYFYLFTFFNELLGGGVCHCSFFHLCLTVQFFFSLQIHTQQHSSLVLIFLL